MNIITLPSSELFTEGIRLLSKPTDTDMGVRPLSPFIISVSAETPNYEQLSVNLYASNSKSIPYSSEFDNNWSALKPQWYFEDINGVKIEESMEIDYDTEVLDEDGNVRGGVGTIEFFYTDNLPSECGVPVMLHVTLDMLNRYDSNYKESKIESYYNSTTSIIIPFPIFPIKPAFIHFSQNGAIEVYGTKWTGSNIHTYATINGIPRSKFLDYDKCAVEYPIIFNSPKYPSNGLTNNLGYTIYPLSGAEMTPSASPMSTFLPFKLDSGIADGGWSEVNATSWVEASGALLTGAVSIEYDESDYDCINTNNISMWVSNRTANLLHKLETIYIDTTNPSMQEFYSLNGENIYNNIYSTGFSVPTFFIDDYNPTINADIRSNVRELTDYSGVYGIAVYDNDTVWSVDFELDRIYKRDAVGNTIFTVDLQKQSIGGMPPAYADSEYTWYGPSSISLNRTGDAYVTLYNSPSAIKITSDGVIDKIFKPNAIGSSTPQASSDEGTYYRPVDIEVGAAGDIHVLYSNYKKAALIHFDSNGNQSGPSWNTTKGLRPVDMVYVNTNFSETIYTTNLGTNDGHSVTEGGVYKYEWTGSGYNGYRVIANATNAEYITSDGTNVFFTYDDNKVGILTDLDTVNQTNFLNFEIPTTLLDTGIMGGIAVDNSGFLNIIDTYSNIIYRQNISDILTSGVPNFYKIKISPEENYIILNNDGNIERVDATGDQIVPSLQAFGDWTGACWTNKFNEGANFIAYGTPPKKGPYLLLPDNNTSMDVLWQLDSTATSTIEWGLTPDCTDGTQITNEYGADHQHRYSITGLTPQTKYYYKVNGLGRGSFVTANESDTTSLRFTVYGDTRSFPDDQDHVLEVALDNYISDPEYQTFMLHVGDWVQTDVEPDWETMIFPTNQPNLLRFKKDVPIVGCRGNHETYAHINSDVYYKYFPYNYEEPNTFYRSFDYGPLHLIILDQYVPYSVGSTQYNWLEDQLLNSTKTHKIIMLHEPGWTAGGSHSNNETVQDDIQPLCELYGVNIVLGGHCHFYSRCVVNGVNHLTLGGGGAPLRPVVFDDPSHPNIVSAASIHHFAKVEIDGEHLTMDVINTDSATNEVFDSISLGPDVIHGSTITTLSGSSTPFEIKSFNDDYGLRRFNDSWDMQSQIRSYIIPDYQQQFTFLWDDLIGNTVGNSDSGYQTFGRQFYEKISNFVLNHADIDLSNISQVYSIFSSLSLDYDNFDFGYPAELGHWMNILSIVFERLKGSEYPCNRNFKPVRYETIEDCEVCGQIHTSNMGDIILNPVMVVGEPVVLRDTYKDRNAFDIFYPPLSGDYQQLSDYYGYRTPFIENYEIFEYISDPSINVQSEGFINRIDPNNKLDIANISAEEWWGDNGTVEQIFTQILYGGLGTISNYTTTVQSQYTYSFGSIGGDLTYDNTTIVTDGFVESEFVMPVKPNGCSPLSSFGLAFYTTTQAISGPKIELAFPGSRITSGRVTSDQYVKIVIDDDIYYAPSYIINPILSPIAEEGITFVDGFERPEYTLEGVGFLVFDNLGDTLLLPVYK